MRQSKQSDATETIILPKNKWYHWGIREALHYRGLIGLLVRRNFTLQYKQTILGPLWLFLGPLITSLTYSVVFGQFSGIATDGVPHLLFYLSGVNLWTLFSMSVTNIGSTFSANSPIFGKVYFPRLTVPISQTITSIINFLLQTAVFYFFYSYYYAIGQTGGVGWGILWTLVLMLQCALLGLGIGLIITSLTVKYRDLAIAVNYFMTLWMFASPIVYSVSSMTPSLRRILMLNPMTPLTNNFRYFLLGSGTFLGAPMVLSVVVTLAALALGLMLYSKTERTFIDTI